MSVRWLQNGGAINVKQSRYDGGDPEQTALVVKNASRHDIGSYSCELYNEIGIGMSENQVLVDIQCKFLLVFDYKVKDFNFTKML